MAPKLMQSLSLMLGGRLLRASRNGMCQEWSITVMGRSYFRSGFHGFCEC